jgi:hypothetical protein
MIDILRIKSKNAREKLEAENARLREKVDRLETRLAASMAREDAYRDAIKAQQAQEPIYAFRRKWQDKFCTCDKERYDSLSLMPHLFELAIFYATPQPTPDVERDAESERCIMESHQISHSDEYFDARPQIDTADRRRVFEAGFAKGYRAAMKGQS